VRGFPARGYFIPGRDGARARRLGKVPCRRRATESDGEGWGARTSYFHPTRKQAPDKETSTRRGNKHPTRKQALNKETGTQQGNRHSTRKQALNKETGTQQGSKHSTRKQALNKETSTQQGNKHSTSKKALIPRYFPLFLCCTCWTLISFVGLRCFGEVFIDVSTAKWSDEGEGAAAEATQAVLNEQKTHGNIAHKN